MANKRLQKNSMIFANVGPDLAKKIPEQKQNPLNFLKKYDQ